MSQIFDYSGDDDFCLGRSLFPNSKESDLFLSLGRKVHVYFPSRKRSRVSAPFVVSAKRFQQKKQPSIEVLPDECLFEIFRRLPGGQERSVSACVSKRWLMLLSSLRKDEICSKATPLEPEEESNLSKPVLTLECNKDGFIDAKAVQDDSDLATEDQDIEGGGYLSRCLDGKKATDIRLASIAIGTGTRGGLGKLAIRGTNATRGVTDFGLKVIARGCPSLRVLSLWNISSVSNEGLCEIANECHSLEKLDLCQCPAITDTALLAVAKSCPNLTSLTIESCPNVGNESLKAVGQYCPNLKAITIKNCPLVGDQGVASLFSSRGHVLTKVKLQALNLSDVSVAVIGHYGIAVTDLALIGLQNVNERGFWVMGNGQGLQKLRFLTIGACQGVTDLGLEALGKGCPNLKQFIVSKCALLSDNGLVSFVKAAGSLENLQLEECHRIAHGIFGILLSCGGKLKSLSMSNCMGIKDVVFGAPMMPLCSSLKSLSICNCPGFGNASLAMVGRLCTKLTHVELSGLHGITDQGLLPLVHNCEESFVEVNLSGCVNLTDSVVLAIAKLHGGTLELLNLDGCCYITDASLAAISENCSLLGELDVSRNQISDAGIASLARAPLLSLRVLSLSGCGLVSDESLSALKKLGQSLVGLNIQHCRGISHGAAEMLLEQLWRCDILC